MCSCLSLLVDSNCFVMIFFFKGWLYCSVLAESNVPFNLVHSHVCLCVFLSGANKRHNTGFSVKIKDDNVCLRKKPWDFLS